MLILTIVQNFVKLPHLEGTFLKMSYLRVFGLYRPIIYRPDDLFQIFVRILHLPMEIDIWWKFHCHTPSSLGGGTTPPIHLYPYVKKFTYKMKQSSNKIPSYLT